MKELLPTLSTWSANKKPFALATVTQTWGSSPRPVGSVMAVNIDMEMAGSVSGGCVEGDVLRSTKPLLESGGGRQLAYGITNDEAWTVGLTCGGKMEVFLERCPAFDERPAEQAAWDALLDCLQNNRPCTLLTRLDDGPTAHSLVLPDGKCSGQPLGEALRTAALEAFRLRRSQSLEVAGEKWFANVFPRRSQVLIVGAAHITAHLVGLAKLFDFETIVIDPRGAFASGTQFPSPPDQLLAEYPAEVLPNFPLDGDTYAVILSHDPKIDDNALHLLLRSDVRYIGALGSRKTHANRVARLQAAGFSEGEIARIQSPIGLDIGARTPAEIALSVIGELVQARNAER